MGYTPNEQPAMGPDAEPKWEDQNNQNIGNINDYPSARING